MGPGQKKMLQKTLFVCLCVFQCVHSTSSVLRVMALPPAKKIHHVEKGKTEVIVSPLFGHYEVIVGGSIIRAKTRTGAPSGAVLNWSASLFCSLSWVIINNCRVQPNYQEIIIL